MYIRNSSGPSIDPWGTPALTCRISERLPSTADCAFLLELSIVGPQLILESQGQFGFLNFAFLPHNNSYRLTYSDDTSYMCWPLLENLFLIECPKVKVKYGNFIFALFKVVLVFSWSGTIPILEWKGQSQILSSNNAWFPHYSSLHFHIHYLVFLNIFWLWLVLILGSKGQGQAERDLFVGGGGICPLKKALVLPPARKLGGILESPSGDLSLYKVKTIIWLSAWRFDVTIRTTNGHRTSGPRANGHCAICPVMITLKGLTSQMMLKH